MKKNSLAITVLVALVVGVGGFFAGVTYQKTQAASGNQERGQFTQRMQGGPGGQNKMLFGQGQRGSVGGASGEVISVDDKTITVKMPDGSSKIVVVSDSTTYNKSTSASKDEVKIGETIAVFGTPNSDGSVTAQNIQVNPTMRMMQGSGRGNTEK